MRLLFALLFCAAASASSTAPLLSFQSVVISQSTPRFENALTVLSELGFDPLSVRHHLPMNWRARHLYEKFQAFFPGVVPTKLQLTTLSLTQANEDIMSLILGSSAGSNLSTSEWWLVFEDDIALATSAATARAAIRTVLDLALGDGIASFGMCGINITRGGKASIAADGVDYARLSGCCTHGMAYHPSKVDKWLLGFRTLVPNTRYPPQHRYGVDLQLREAAKSMWVAGATTPSPLYHQDSTVGILFQNRSQFKSVRSQVTEQ